MIKRKIVLHFPKKVVDKPIIYSLIKDYGLVFNILKAQITPDAEGLAIMELSGDEKNYNAGIKHLEEQGVKIQPLSKDVTRNEEKCTHCGACVSLCPTGALFVKDKKTREIGFNKDKCIACEICVKSCPPRALEINY